LSLLYILINKLEYILRRHTDYVTLSVLIKRSNLRQ